MSKLSDTNKARIDQLCDLRIWIQVHQPETEEVHCILDCIDHMIKSIHKVPEQRFFKWVDTPEKAE